MYRIAIATQKNIEFQTLLRVQAHEVSSKGSMIDAVQLICHGRAEIELEVEAAGYGGNGDSKFFFFFLPLFSDMRTPVGFVVFSPWMYPVDDYALLSPAT